LPEKTGGSWEMWRRNAMKNRDLTKKSGGFGWGFIGI